WRQHDLVSLAVLHDDAFTIGFFAHSADLHLHPSADTRGARTLHVRAPPGEALPISDASQRTLHSRRGDFQHIPPVNQFRRTVQLRFDRSRCALAVPDLHPLLIATVDRTSRTGRFRLPPT